MKLKIGLFLVAVTIAAAVAVRIGTETRPIPEELIGVWHSDAPGYENRFFELSDAIFVFGQGDRRLDIQFITAIETKNVEKNLTRYAIFHKDRNGFEQITIFYFNRENGNTIWFNNQPDITWKKFILSKKPLLKPAAST